MTWHTFFTITAAGAPPRCPAADSQSRNWPKTVSWTRAVLGHAVFEVGGLRVAYIVEGDDQPAAPVGRRGVHVGLQVSELLIGRAVHRDCA